MENQNVLFVKLMNVKKVVLMFLIEKHIILCQKDMIVEMKKIG